MCLSLYFLISNRWFVFRQSSDLLRCHPSQIAHFCFAGINDLTIDFNVSTRALPVFENLCSLDLRNLYGDRIWGNVNVVQWNLAEILIKSPNLKKLGLGLKEEDHQVFLKEVIAHFKRVREANGKPEFRLRIQELVWGRGIALPKTGPQESSNLLEEFTNLLELRSLKIFIEENAMDHRLVMLDYGLFLQATKLISLSISDMRIEFVRLINALSCHGNLGEIQVKSIKDYNDFDTRLWCRPLAELGGGWRKLLLGGDLFDVCPEPVYNDLFESLFPRSCDVEEIGIPYLRWVSSLLLLPSILALLIHNPGHRQV